MGIQKMNSKRTDLNLTISIITLNVNGLNMQIRQTGGGKKPKTQLFAAYKKINCKQRHKWVKIKWMEKKIYFDNTNQKKAVLSILILASSSSKQTVLTFDRI